MQAKKRFGQHFLNDSYTATRIVDAIAPRPGDTIIEIGPGLGALTIPLLQYKIHLEAVEIDPSLAKRLAQRLRDCPSFRLHCQDVLEFDFTAVHRNGRTRVVGNLPYSISAPLLMHLYNACEHILDMHLMLQTEVVERIVAKAGSRNYSRLSVISDCFVKAQHLFNVAPEAFSPPPRVNSSVIRLLPRPCPVATQRRRALFRLVNKAFSQRRKTIGKIFSGIFSEDDFTLMQLTATARPEELETKHFLVMLDLLGDKLNGSKEVK